MINRVNCLAPKAEKKLRRRVRHAERQQAKRQTKEILSCFRP